MKSLIHRLVALFCLAFVPPSLHAQSSFDFPPAFKTIDIPVNGTTIHVRHGGTGPAVILVHGYGETGDMWVPMAADLARDCTVVGLTYAVSACPRSRLEASTRRPRRGTSPASWTRSGSSASTSSRTTSATWWSSSSPRSIRTGCARSC